MSAGISAQVNWDSVRDEVTTHLQDLIRFETVNPPGNEIQVATHLRDVVSTVGLSSHILESDPGRASFVTRIGGEGKGRPLMLMAHSDVVSVEADKWQHPPFAADIADGMIWGRGAVDTKNLVASELLVMLLIRRMGLTLDRDLIMCTFADEEAGGRYGATWMWENHRDLIDAEVAINEGGGNAIEQDASADDGYLDLYSLEFSTVWKMALMLRSFRNGQHGLWEEVRTDKCTKFEIRTRKPKPVNVDGEIVTSTPAVFEVLPKAVRVFAPREA